MKVSGSLPYFGNSVFDVTIVVDNPLSGFEFSIQDSGDAPPTDLVQFSGSEGYVFDQSGNFCGGYQSGIPFDISIHYSVDTTGFKYYFNNVLVANNISGLADTASNPNQIEFEKYGDSSLTVSATGADGVAV